MNLAAADKQSEFDEICSLTNPTVKKVLLKSFADDCDAAAVHLQAAALPRQKYQVILPLTSIKDNEVYAPNGLSGSSLIGFRTSILGVPFFLLVLNITSTPSGRSSE